MPRLTYGTPTLRLVALTVTGLLVFSACRSNEVTGSSTDSFTECSGQPGCQSATTAVAPEVLHALADASTRVVAALTPAVRSALQTPLARLATALQERDIEGGRSALSAALAAITEAERASDESTPDLGVLRLELVPAARSLGLPISVTESPIP